MAERRRVALGALVLVPFLVGAAAGAPGAAGHPAFRFQDPEIVESSGLVVLPGTGPDGGLVVTTNDSGDSGRVFTVAPATGATVGVTSWASDPEDVEALAPAGPGQVWVADTGDNRHARDSVSVLRVPVGRGDRDVVPETYDLVYPDGARDAEALLLSTEGARSAVLSVPLPPEARAADLRGAAWTALRWLATARGFPLSG